MEWLLVLGLVAAVVVFGRTRTGPHERFRALWADPRYRAGAAVAFGSPSEPTGEGQRIILTNPPADLDAGLSLGADHLASLGVPRRSAHRELEFLMHYMAHHQMVMIAPPSNPGSEIKLELSDGWMPFGNFLEGLPCPLCGAEPRENGLNFPLFTDQNGISIDLMMQMPCLQGVKVAVCKKCKGRYEWKCEPQASSNHCLFLIWRPSSAPSPIPANATPEERVDWELWLKATAEETVEAFEGYLQNSQLHLFTSEANTLLRWKKSTAKH